MTCEYQDRCEVYRFYKQECKGDPNLCPVAEQYNLEGNFLDESILMIDMRLSSLMEEIKDLRKSEEELFARV